MKEYDFAFSCGYSCAVTEALRAADLQFASFPFDWTASPGFRRCAKMIADDFEGWMEKDDLELVDIRRRGINKHVYLNRRTKFGFVHDFSSFKTFDESFSKVAQKYARRIERLDAQLRQAKRVLAVCAEWPILPRITDAELEETREILQRKFPNAEFDLLYFHCEAGRKGSEVVRVGEHITIVANDYRTFEYGEVNHEMDNAALIEYLKREVRAVDPRSEEEKRKYTDDWKAQDRARWHGRNWLETFVNRTKFRHYRRLEKFLTAKGLVPRERPMWILAPKIEER